MPGEENGRHVPDAFQQSEAASRSILNCINAAVFVVRVADNRILDANQKACAWLGYDREMLLAMNHADILEADQGPVDAAALEHLSPGDYLTVDQIYRSKTGGTIPAQASHCLFDCDGQRAILSTVRDLSQDETLAESAAAQRELAEALRGAAATLSSGLKLDEIVERLLPHISRVIPCEGVNIMLIDGDQARMIAQWGYDQIGAKIAGWLEKDWPVNEIAETHWILQHRRPLAIPDTQDSPHWTSEAANWVNSYVGAPIIVDNTIIGIINLDHRQANQFNDVHAENLLAFANQAGIAIQNARLHQDLQQSAKDLEARVEERTQELREVNRTLAAQINHCQQVESELARERNLLRTVIDNIPDEIYVKSPDGIISLANKALERRMAPRAPKGRVIGSTDFDFMSEEQAKKYQTQEMALVDGADSIVSEEVLISDEHGGKRWLAATKVPLRDNEDEVHGIIGINRDITEVKQAEERLTHMISGARCMFWYAIVTEQDGILDWEMYVSNVEAAQRFLPLEVPEGRDYPFAWLSSVLPEDQADKDATGTTAILKGKPEYQIEYRCKDATGQVRWMYEDAQVRSLTEGRYSVVGICTDITERKHAEATLQRANELLEQRVAARTAELSASNQDLKNQISERERAQQAEREQRLLFEALGNTAAALTETLDLDTVLDRILVHAGRVVPPHENASIMLIEDEIFVRTLRVRDHIDGQVVTKSGGERFFLHSLLTLQWILGRNQPLVIKDTQESELWIHDGQREWLRSHVGVPIHVEGKIIGFLNLGSKRPGQFTEEHAERLLAFSDQVGVAIRNARLYETVSSHASTMEMRVAERTSELERERGQLRAVMDSITDGVVYEHEPNAPEYINQALIDLTGYDEVEWRDFLHVLQQLTGWDPAQARQQSTQIRESVLRQGIWNGEMKLSRKNGEVFDARLVATNVLDSRGQPAGMVIVIRDVSAAKRLEDQKARFITTASHELRTPIANIKTRLYLIGRQPEKTQDHLEIISSVTEDMHVLIDNLLDVSRFQYGAIALNRKNFILQDLISEVIEVQRPDADRKTIAITDNLAEQPISIWADRPRINQVLTNLLTNGIQYTPEGGEITVQMRTHMEVANDSQQRYVLISVCDTGRGISEEALSEIFKPFFRENDYDSGLGLGLSITREIVELHGGEISVSSTETEGTCFKVKLPLAPKDPDLP